MMISGDFAVKFEWGMLGLTVPFVLLRLYSRCWITRNASSSDIVVLVTWVLFAIGTAQDYVVYRLGLHNSEYAYTKEIIDLIPDKEALVKILKICFTSTIPYYGTLWGVKFSLVLLYNKLIPDSIPYLRRALQATTMFLGASFLIVICLNMFWCLPIETNWTLDKSKACFAYAAYVPYFVTTAFHIVTDFMVLALPFPLLKVLNLTPRKRVEVGALFALGGLCIICTIVRVIEVGLDAKVAVVSVWSAVEQATGIIVVCAPALKCIGSCPLASPQMDLESGNRSIHGQGWWTAGRATPKRRDSGGIALACPAAHDILPKTFLRFSNSHQQEGAWESLPDKQPLDSQVIVVEQRLSSVDVSSSSYSEDSNITKPNVAAQRPS